MVGLGLSFENSGLNLDLKIWQSAHLCFATQNTPVLKMIRFPDRDPTEFFISEPDRTGFRKNFTGSDMDIQTAFITAVKCLISFFFGYKPDWIKNLDSTTGLGSDWITHWKYWTGLGLQKSSIRSTLEHTPLLLSSRAAYKYFHCGTQLQIWYSWRKGNSEKNLPGLYKLENRRLYRYSQISVSVTIAVFFSLYIGFFGFIWCSGVFIESLFFFTLVKFQKCMLYCCIFHSIKKYGSFWMCRVISSQYRDG